MTEIKSYDRLEEETNAAWLGFCCYRDLGPGRTMEEAARQYAIARRQGKVYDRHEKHDRRSGQFSKWGKNHDWLNRAESWDRDRERDRLSAIAQSDWQSFDKAIKEYRDVVEAATRKVSSFTLRGVLNVDDAMNRLTRKIKELDATLLMPAAYRKENGELIDQGLSAMRVIKESTEVVERTYGIRLVVDDALKTHEQSQ